MRIVMWIAEILLAVWFFGCICTYQWGSRILVEGMGVKSPEFGMFFMHGAGVVLFAAVPAVGKWWLLAVLAAWLVIQFFCHWYYTLFGASEKKLKGYNACFRNTVHLIPASDTRLIPDLYHMILHLLILWNLVLVICAIVR